MRPEDFSHLSALLSARAGYAIGPEKTYLAESRLVPLARKRGMEGLDQLMQRLRAGNEPALERETVEAMIAGETWFFRDRAVWDFLRRSLLLRLAASRGPGGKLRLWSIGCGAGQEAFSLAMIIAEEPTLSAMRIDLVASDLSAAMLERARRGLFSSFEVQRGLPVRQLLAHFSQSQDLWEIAPALQRRVGFEAFNLLDDPASFGRFDLILCRNVLGGMVEPAGAKARAALSKQVAHDGALVLGLKEGGTLPLPGLLPFPEAPAGVFRPV